MGKAHPTKMVRNLQALPLVSVGIPTYNGERFIAEAIATIFAQTYPNLELIICDDGSSDQTVAIAQSFQKQANFPINIIVYSNQGLAQNSNNCINNSQGKYIKLLFQDDLLDPNCIELMVEKAEQDPEIGLVFSPRSMFFSDQSEIDDYLMTVYQEFKDLHQAWANLKSIQWGQELLADSHLFCHPINKIGEPSTVLLRKSVFETVKGFDPELNQLVDLDLWWRIFSHFKVGFVNQTLSYFRLHRQQKTYENMQNLEAADANFYYKIYFDPDYDFFAQSIRHHALLIYTLVLIENYHHSDFQQNICLEKIRKLRSEIAQAWLTVPVDQLERLANHDFKRVYWILCRNQRLFEPLTKPEEQFIQQLSQILQSETKPERILQLILAMMLYLPASPVQLQPSVLPIPDGLGKDMIKWLSR